METRANYALIGAFTLAVIAMLFGFVFWFSGSETGQGRQAVRVVFSGSISGLSKGSAVHFNGIRVGEVKELGLLPDDPRRVLSTIEIDRTTPLRSDTRARLEFQGLTGVAQVALIGGEPSAPALSAGPGQSLPTIFAERSDFQDLLESARKIAGRADDMLERVNRVVADNEAGITRTMQNVERFSKALNDNAPGIDRFLAKVGQAAEHIAPLAAKLETLSGEVSGLVRAIDPQRVARTVQNVEGFTQTLANSREDVTKTFRDVALLAQGLKETSGKLDATLGDVSRLVKAVDPGQINRTFANVESFSATLAGNRQNVEAILRDGAVLTKQLSVSSGKLDVALDDVSTLVKAVDAKALNKTFVNLEGFTRTLAENRESVASFLRDASALAKAINAEQINRVVANAERFTAALGNASPDVEKTVAEARGLVEKLNQSANRVDGVLKAAEGFLGSGSGEVGKGTFGEVKEAAKAVRVLAENLDKRTADITSGINRFTGSGLREVEVLTTEGRRTLNEIGRTVRSLERNPQQVIFGSKPTIPEYKSR